MKTTRLAWVMAGCLWAACPGAVLAGEAGKAGMPVTPRPLTIEEEQAAALARFEQGYAWTKKSDPELYARELERFNRNWEIRKITHAFLHKQMTREDARAALLPLVEDNIKEQGAQADEQIARLKQQIANWEEMRDKPDAAQEAEIDRLLGIDQPPGPPAPPVPAAEPACPTGRCKSP